nr:gamma-glutamyl-gamma-aminobutyrate hydrolase family protein [Bacilli bacterium]
MIGILGRLDKTPSNKDAYIIYKSITDMLDKYDITYIGIIPNSINKIKDVIDMCDGIILSGGDKESIYDYEIIKYIYDNNIPCLGICMGMQQMCMLYGGKLKKVDNHYSNDIYLHDVNITNSKIYGNKKIKVNSRHHDGIVKTDLYVTGISDVIEMVEDNHKKFFVGVEWHPEDLYMFDEDAKKLINMFIKSIK